MRRIVVSISRGLATYHDGQVVSGLGDLHMRYILDRLQSQYHVEVTSKPPRIPYRETITSKAEGHHRHKKQTGGAGQFGEVYLRVEPLKRGSGFEFVDAVKGGVIPTQYIPAVEKGIRQALEAGPLAQGATQVQVLHQQASALHGLLQRVRDLGLPLISVTELESTDHERN